MNWGQTPLHLACSSGHLDVVRYLATDHNANLEAADNDGLTPLHWVCRLGYRELARFLLAEGADLFAVSGDGKTAFDWAYETSLTRDVATRTNLVDFLLRTYAAMNAGHEDSLAIHSILQTATFLEVENFHPPLALPPQVHLPLGNLTVDHFTSLLQWFPDASFRRRDNNGALPRDDLGALPLHVACEKGAPVEIVRPLLLRHAAALDMTNDINGDLPLHAACRAAAAAESLIRFLAEQDPNAVQAPNNDGALPLHLLCGSPRPTLRTVKYLLGLFQGALEMGTNQW